MGRLAMAVGLVCGLAGCGDAAPPEMPAELTGFYEMLRGDADGFDVAVGEWTEDYGDAPFYGTAFYVRAGLQLDDGDYITLAREARDYDLTVVEAATGDLDYFTTNMEEVLMAALGLIEYAAATGDASDLDALDAFIDETNQMVRLFGNYLPTDAELGAFALSTYGPTAITGAVALLDLQYAALLDTPRRQERIDTAVRIVEAIDRRAWDVDHYRFQPDEDRLFLYPNSILMLVLGRLSEVTGDRAWARKAEQVAEAIAPLKQLERGGYRSPYSAEYMGAMTDDYSTLSSQNYLALAFVLLYQQTHHGRWLDEAFGILTFIRTRLYDPAQRRLLHHWMDGRIAQPEDPEYFCSGCNLQTLYVLWYLQNEVLA